MLSISYHLIDSITQEEAYMLRTLYEAASWWDADWDMAWLEEVVKRSTLFIVAKQGDHIIGMGRMISDSISDGYIQDITVLPAYQGRGIGGHIVGELVKKAQERSIDWIGLVGAPNTESFYIKLGFTPLEAHVPYIYSGVKK